jgi:hypothetical protein
MGNILHLSKKSNKERNPKMDAIEEYIDGFLHNEEINTCLPDKMERKMYKKVLIKTIALLEKVLETTEIKILNHRIRLVLEPLEEEEKPEDENV